MADKYFAMSRVQLERDGSAGAKKEIARRGGKSKASKPARASARSVTRTKAQAPETYGTVKLSTEGKVLDYLHTLSKKKIEDAVYGSGSKLRTTLMERFNISRELAEGLIGAAYTDNVYDETGED